MAAFIRMVCPGCGDMIQAPSVSAGQPARCPCGARFTLPAEEDDSLPVPLPEPPARASVISGRAAIACSLILTVGAVLCVYLLRPDSSPLPLAHSHEVPVAVQPVLHVPVAEPLAKVDAEAIAAKAREVERKRVEEAQRIAAERAMAEERKKDEDRKLAEEKELRDREDRLAGAKGFLQAQAAIILGFSYPTAELTDMVFDAAKPRNDGVELHYTLKYFSPFEDNGQVQFAFRFDRDGKFSSLRCVGRSAFLPPGSTITFIKDALQEELNRDPELRDNPLLRPALAEGDAMQMLTAVLQSRQ